MNITDLYYKFKKMLGLPEFSSSRIREAELLYPERRPEDIVREQDEKLINKSVVFVTAAALVFVMAVIINGLSEKTLSQLERPQYGNGTGSERVEVIYDDDTFEMEVSVEEKELSSEKREELFEAARKELTASLIGENSTPKRISRRLNLSAKTSVSHVEASWQITDYGLIGYDGSLLFPEDFTDGTKTVVKLHLFIGEEKREYPVELTLYRPAPEEMSAEELMAEAISKENENRENEETIKLPKEVNGRKVIFVDPSAGVSLAGVFALAAAVGGVLIYRQKNKRKEELKERKTQLELAYSEFAMKLSLLIGAGLSIGRAWEKLAADYKKEKEKRPKEKHYLSYEIDYCARLVNSGVSWEAALIKFGERTGLPGYMRLAGFLETSRKNGRDDLRQKLAAEARDAFEKRILLAKRQGEKLSSGLLIPMFIQFGLIMAILIIPAFLSW